MDVAMRSLSTPEGQAVMPALCAFLTEYFFWPVQKLGKYGKATYIYCHGTTTGRHLFRRKNLASILAYLRCSDDIFGSVST
jgi:hypothetical protein